MKELELFQVKVREQPQGFMTMQQAIDSHYPALASDIKQQTGAPTEAVASSIFMRRFGFFITAQLYLLAHGKTWDGPFDAVHLVKTEGGIAFEIDERFIRNREEGDLEKVLKDYAFPVVEAVRKAGHVSKLILWENIWGYVIWMYGMLESVQAEQDAAILLDAAIWQPEMRRSPFQQFLGGHSFEESKADYQRITCCLYKELPDTGKCPYCPVKK